jgi:hypothetical protein
MKANISESDHRAYDENNERGGQYGKDKPSLALHDASPLPAKAMWP